MYRTLHCSNPKCDKVFNILIEQTSLKPFGWKLISPLIKKGVKTTFYSCSDECQQIINTLYKLENLN